VAWSRGKTIGEGSAIVAFTLQYRICRGSDKMPLHPLKVAQLVQVQGADFHIAHPALAQVFKVRSGGLDLQRPERFLFLDQQAGGAVVAGHQQGRGGAQVGNQAVHDKK
jgi:hypothetical protein